MSVIWQITTSADGFVCGPDGDLSWIFERDWGGNPIAAELVRLCGAFVVGHRMVQDGDDADSIYGGAWSGPVFVVTHDTSLRDYPPVHWVSDGVEAAIERAVAAAGADRDVVVTGSDVAGQCAQAGLVDELMLHVVPILLGAGTPLFRRPDGPRLRMELVETSRAGEVVNQRYRFAG